MSGIGQRAVQQALVALLAALVVETHGASSALVQRKGSAEGAEDLSVALTATGIEVKASWSVVVQLVVAAVFVLMTWLWIRQRTQASETSTPAASTRSVTQVHAPTREHAGRLKEQMLVDDLIKSYEQHLREQKAEFDAIELNLRREVAGLKKDLERLRSP